MHLIFETTLWRLFLYVKGNEQEMQKKLKFEASKHTKTVKEVMKYAAAEMRTLMKDWNGAATKRIRMYVRKQCKKPKTRATNLKKLGMFEWQAYRNGNIEKAIGELQTMSFRHIP